MIITSGGVSKRCNNQTAKSWYNRLESCSTLGYVNGMQASVFIKKHFFIFFWEFTFRLSPKVVANPKLFIMQTSNCSEMILISCSLCIYTFNGWFSVSFLAHLSRRLKWAFLIKICPLSVVVVVVVNFSHFHLLLQNHWANFNQTWHKAPLGKGDSSLFKWRAPPFSKGR